MSYNTSDNSIEVQAKLSPSHNSYTVSGVPGVTYYITVFAVNALGPGPISEYTTVNGELNTLSYDFHEVIYSVPLLPTTTSSQFSTNTRLYTDSMMKSSYQVISTNSCKFTSSMS